MESNAWKNIPEVVYTVRVLVLVDHPEKRNASFRPVAAGSTSLWEKQTTSHETARALREEALAGWWDAGSEYCTRVEVEAKNVRTEKRRWAFSPLCRTMRGQPFQA